MERNQEYAAGRLLQVIPLLFRQLMAEVRDEMPAEICEMGGSQFHLVHALHHKESTTGELAERLKVSTPTISRMVETLVERGYVDRRPDPVDRRKVWLRLTRQGAELAEMIEIRFRDVVAEFLEPLSTNQLAQIIAAFDTLEDLLSKSRSKENKAHNCREEL